MVIEITVHIDKKVILFTDSRPTASNIGLMNTPSPTPQIAPIMDANKLTKKIT